MKLPAEARIHPVFNESQLQLAVREHTVEIELPEELQQGPGLQPLKVLGTRVQSNEGGEVPRVLIQWIGRSADEAT